MTVLVRASFGYLLRHPWQLGLAILGITIGVAVMVAVDLANESSRKAFLWSMDAINGQATHQIIAGPGGLDQRFYVELRVEQGLTGIAPVVAGTIRAGNMTLQALGVDLFAERQFRNFSAPGDLDSELAETTTDSAAAQTNIVRRFLSGDGSVLMSADTASRLGIKPGDAIEVSANGKRHQATLLAIFRGADQDRLHDIIVTDISVAQQWFEMQGRLTRIDVRIDAGDQTTAEGIQQSLPPGTEFLSASGRTRTTAAMSDAFMTNLSAMSLLALLVGVFLIYNSVAFAVLQRRGLIGVLRAIGVTRREIVGLILGEAALLGTIGAILGLLAGILLGERLLLLVARTVSDHFFVVNVTDVSLSWMSLAKGVVAGLAATLVAALAPAMEASSYQPRLALTRSSLERRTASLLPLLGVAGLVLIGLAVVLVAVSGNSLVAGLAALFVLILGFALCIPLAAQRISAWCTPLAGLLGGSAGRLAIGSIGKTLSRTGVAIVALSIAVAATIGVTVMVDSFRDSVSDWLDNTLQSDIYLGVPRGSLDTALLQDLVAVPGIAEYSSSRRTWLESATGRTRLIALQMAPGSYAGIRLREADPAIVWRQFDNESAVLVSDTYAFRNSVGRDDTVPINSRDGEIELRIAAIYQSYDSNDGAIMMSRRTYDRHFDDPGIDSIGIYLESGISADAVMNKLRDVSENRQALLINSNARIRDLSLNIFDRTFLITNVLYWLAVGVAVIGIVGAMFALQLERLREFGVLRALGMTPGQTAMLVTAQSGFIGFLAGLAAIPLGLVMAWVLIEVINRRAFGWQIDMVVGGQSLLWAMALAVSAALLAGIYPALQASRVRPALAMREE